MLCIHCVINNGLVGSGEGETSRGSNLHSQTVFADCCKGDSEGGGPHRSYKEGRRGERVRPCAPSRGSPEERGDGEREERESARAEKVRSRDERRASTPPDREFEGGEVCSGRCNPFFTSC